jgi:hypothetical protein
MVTSYRPGGSFTLGTVSEVSDIFRFDRAGSPRTAGTLGPKPITVQAPERHAEGPCLRRANRRHGPIDL